MKFDELVYMYLEDFLPSKETSRYTTGNKGYSTTGPINSLKGKPSGFKGDDGKAGENEVIPSELFPDRKKTKDKSKKNIK